MDGVGNEVSHKIRAAIKAKLIELGAYVDDELPDYIMVMVANKRSRVQMEEDLSLFLNNNTKVFTSWLHTVLQKLQEVTVAANDKKVIRKKSSPSPESTGKVVSPLGDKKSKKKHAKKHKEKKQKKTKHKNKEPKMKKPDRVPVETSDWEDEVVIPKKKVKKEKEDLLDVTKEVGRAIIGSLKEKHKGDEISVMISEHPSTQLTAQDDAPEVILGEMVDSALALTVIPPELPAIVAPSLAEDPVEPDQAKEDVESDGLSIIEVKLNSNNSASKSQSEPTILAPTRELMKKHDKLTTDAPKPKPASQASSEESVSPEELRRELLLSRAKRKLEQRNLERRMRSNSPEVLIVEETPAAKKDTKSTDKAPTVPPPAPAPAKKRSEPRSPRLSLSPSSFLGSSSPVNSLRRTTGRQSRNERPKVLVQSRIVAPPEPDEPGVSSVVHVKPREFAPNEKQANKKLILKAVAAAERSVATVPARKSKELPPKAGKRPRALFTKDLRGKRYENFAVTLPNDADRGRPRQVDVDLESESNDLKNKEAEEENFISSKCNTKDKNESFIKIWLEDVEEAGKQDALIKPDEIDEGASGEDGNVSEKEVVKGSNGAEGRIEASQDGPQIVVTVDGLRSNREGPVRVARDRKIKSLVDVNRISNRFARISQPAEEHEFKEKYREFERVRTEKKISREGESKNKRLIAELSMKFGKVNRVFEEEDEGKPVRKRVGDLRRGDELVRKREAGRSGGEESTSREKREKKSSRISVDQDEVRSKSKERCRFWPDCARGPSCDYHHPSFACKLLPNCKLKDKCMYVHPVCKNDRDCTLKDCAYEHPSARRRRSDHSLESLKGICKYDSYCKNLDCPYLHSKRTCRFGARCKNRECTYLHTHNAPA